jgi:two-component system, chemotaxis family, response regulator Rcp1
VPTLINVLMVDDDDSDIELTQRAIEDGEVPFRLHVVNSGREALQYLSKSAPYTASADPDLIMLNLNLPGKNGKEVLADIKSDEKLKDIPLLVFSSSIPQPALMTAYGLPERCFVTKPFRFDELIDTMKSIEHWVRRREWPEP